MVLAVWIVSLVTNGGVFLYSWMRITDENEAGLPISARSSWQLFRPKRFPWTVLSEHRRRYPGSRIRLWATFSTGLECALIATPFLVAVFRSVVGR